MFPLVQMLLRISQERVPRIFNLHLRNGILWLLEDLFLARTVSITISFAVPISSGLPTESLVRNESVFQDIGRCLDLLNRLVACDPASFNRNKETAITPSPLRSRATIILHAPSITLTSSSSAPLPPAPPELKIVPTFNEETRLDPAEVYLVIISAMDQLSMQPWSGPVDLSSSSVILSPGQRVALTTFGESQQLQPGHIILALYHIVLRMYNQRPGFYKLSCVVSLRERKIATIYMVRERYLSSVA